MIAAIRFRVWLKTQTAGSPGTAQMQFLATDGQEDVLGIGEPSGVIDIRLAKSIADQLEVDKDYVFTIEPAPEVPPAG